MLLIYSSGLRRSELINLRKEDVNFEENYVFVHNGKGGKDRQTLLSQKAKQALQLYFKAYDPTFWLFEGQHGGPYSASSIQNIFKKAKIATGINRRATIHWLRHSFASHLILRGVDIAFVQKLLGHESIKTTQIYLHISDVQIRQLESPLDHLDISI